MNNYWSKQAINERLFNPKQLNVNTLKDFIANYPIPFSSLTNEPYQQSYLDGIKDVLADLEAAFLHKSAEQVAIKRLNSLGEWISINPSDISKEELESRLRDRGYKTNRETLGRTRALCKSRKEKGVEGIHDFVSDVEGDWLKTYGDDNPHAGTTLDSYLESDELIDECIKQAKANLDNMRGLTANMKSLSEEDEYKVREYIESISFPGFPNF